MDSKKKRKKNVVMHSDAIQNSNSNSNVFCDVLVFSIRFSSDLQCMSIITFSLKLLLTFIQCPAIFFCCLVIVKTRLC